MNADSRTLRDQHGISVPVILLLVLLIAVVAFVLAARFDLLTPADAELRQRFGLPGSQFVDLAGETVHVVDEGQGEPVVLLHGSFASLRQWDEWTAALRQAGYRVIRYDRPPMGLSGRAGGAHRDGAQDQRVLAALVDHLGLGQVVLVATSSAGPIGTGYAAAHPQHLRAVVLSNIPAGEFRTDSAHLPRLMRLLIAVEPVFGGWHSRVFWREVLRENFADPAKVTREQVEQWTDMNNRARRVPDLAGAPRNAMAEFARIPQDLAQIRAPALVLWSDADRELPLETHGRQVLQLLASTDKSLQVVPHCGHLLPLECGADSVRETLRFLAHLPPAASVTGAAQGPPRP